MRGWGFGYGVLGACFFILLGFPGLFSWGVDGSTEHHIGGLVALSLAFGGQVRDDYIGGFCLLHMWI